MSFLFEENLIMPPIFDVDEFRQPSFGDIVVNGDPGSTGLSGWQVQLFFDQMISPYASPSNLIGEPTDYSLSEDWNPEGDDDGDGILNKDDDSIVITGLVTSDRAAIASAIGTDLANQHLLVFGFMFGYMGLGIAEALVAAGVSPSIAAGVAGAITATGNPSSVADAIGQVSDRLREFYTNVIIQDMAGNPENYSSWRINPFTGHPFDANSNPYNQHD